MKQFEIKILVICDSTDTLLPVRALINDVFPDAAVLTTLSGEQGIAMAIENDPDVILLDSVMPVMDGFEVCRKLKESEKTLEMPVVFLTDPGGDPQQRIRALECGADAFLSKPIDQSELLAQIRAMVKIREAALMHYSEKERLAEMVKLRTAELDRAHLKVLNLYEELRVENEERKRTEAALLHSDALMRYIVEHNRSAIAVFDREMRYLFFSRRLMEDYRLKDEEIIGKCHYDIFPEISPEWREVHRKALSGKTLSSQEEKFPRGDGSVDWVQRECRPWYEIDGTIGGIILYTEVITKRKEAELALKEAEERYKTFISSLSEGIFRLETDLPIDISLPADEQVDLIYQHMYIAECNEAFSRMFGYGSPDKVLDRHYSHFSKCGEDPCHRKILLDFVQNGYRYDSGTVQEHDLNGKEISLSTNALGIFDDGRLVRIWGTLTDITETVRSREVQDVLYQISRTALTTDLFYKLLDEVKLQLGRLIDSKNFYIALYDEESDLLTTHHVQDEMDNIECWPAEKSLTGYVVKHRRSLLANEEKVASLQRRGVVGQVGTPSKIWLGVPMIVRGKAFGAIVVQNYHDPLAYTEKDLQLLEFISGQISVSIERKKAEGELKEALSRAQESDRLKTAFLANMSHEIRTPMNGIMGFSELLQDPGLTGEEQQQYIGIIRKSGARMLNVINEIIDISKIEAGQAELNLEKVNINEKVEYVYNLLQPEAEAKNITLTYYTSLSAREAFIDTDETKFYSILLNLVKNAIKYTNQGTIEFGYYLKKGTADTGSREGELTFFVRDTGIGIPANRQEAVFERFIQADIADIHARQGAGLGLSIAKAYVELLGGRIWLESTEGVGSTFYFTHPLHSIASSRKTTVTAGTASVGQEDHLRPLNILIVEDDLASALYVKAMMGGAGHTIRHVTSGDEAVNACRKDSRIDLVLMDIRLPELNGYEATRQIRSFNTDVRIIAVTAFALTGDRELALQAGCNAYIAKPVRQEELQRTIRSVMRE
jgi:PAS domain S-box-containing protein